MAGLTEPALEQAALDWLAGLGYATLYGPTIAPGEPAAERETFSDVVLVRRLRKAIARLNPDAPQATQDEAVRQVLLLDSPSLLGRNRLFHRMLTDGVEVEALAPNGGLQGYRVQLVDFDRSAANDFLAVNQFTVIEGHANRRADIVVFVNGLPLAVIELKNLANEEVDAYDAFSQIQTYQQGIPSLFAYNELNVVSDGIDARIGSLTAPFERFAPWRTIDGREVLPLKHSELEVLLRGVFEPERLLDLVRHFIVFEDDGDTVEKKLAADHQFHAALLAGRWELEWDGRT